MSPSPFALAIPVPGDLFSFADSAIEWVYLGCAALGGLVLVIQIVASLFGADHDAGHDFHDVGGGDHGSMAGSWLSFRTVVAFLTFFGLGGLVGATRGWSNLASLGLAVLCGGAALVLTRLVMLQFSRLRSSGTVEIQNAVGSEATVYLTVPAAKAGTGAVTVAIQGRSMQFRAVTAGAELKTGALCKVRAVHAGDTLEVESL
ncbi:MAG: hypothetical protein IPK67_05670 [Planctomycetes bacterium]|nr:hypothetical protein [Planctomycetota bacterium]